MVVERRLEERPLLEGRVLLEEFWKKVLHKGLKNVEFLFRFEVKCEEQLQMEFDILRIQVRLVEGLLEKMVVRVVTVNEEEMARVRESESLHGFL